MSIQKRKMEGKYKPFDPALYAENNTRAINAVIDAITAQGLFATESDDKYGPDITVYKGFRKEFYVEVEIKRVWTADQDRFPWDTVQIPERKAKFLRKQLPIEFWVLRNDLRMALIIPDYLIDVKNKKEVANSLISAGEQFLIVPTDEAVLKDLGD